MLIYEKPKYIRVSYQQEKDYILFDWLNFMVMIDEITELHERALKMAQLKGCYYYIAETSKVRTVLMGSVVAWWGKVWVPRLIEAGLQAIVTVVPTGAVPTLSTHSWQGEVVGPIAMRNAATLWEAERLVRGLQDAAAARSS